MWRLDWQELTGVSGRSLLTVYGLLAGWILLTRVPFRSQLPFNWDAADFLLGMRDYDVTRFQPHPPGYPAWIATGKLLEPLTGDANAALVWAAILFSILATWVLFLLGAAMVRTVTEPDHLGPGWTGGLAAVMLAGSMTFWTYGTVALTYVSLAFFSTAVAWLAWSIRFHGRPWLPVLAVVYGLAGGFRAELLLFLAPIVLLASRGQPLRRMLLSMALGAATLAAWMIPMFALSGGPLAWWTVFRDYSSNDVIQLYSAASLGIGGVARNVTDTASYVFYALYALAVPVAGAGLWWLLRGWRVLPRPLWFVALWVLPMLLFYNLIHVGDPGYVFSVYPGLLALTAVAWSVLLAGQWARRPWLVQTALVVLAGLIAANAAIYLFRDLPLARTGVERHDRVLAAWLGYLDGLERGEGTILIGSDHYRHLVLYYPDTPSFWIDRLSPVRRPIEAAPRDRTLVAVDRDIAPLVLLLPGGRVIPLEGDVVIGVAPVPAGRRVGYGAGYLELLPD